MPNTTDPSEHRPKRAKTASGKVLDKSNTAAPSLSSHKEAIQAKRAEDAKKDAAGQHTSVSGIV
jgi:hypothetical protein